jgi:hypothetical protein
MLRNAKYFVKWSLHPIGEVTFPPPPPFLAGIAGSLSWPWGKGPQVMKKGFRDWLEARGYDPKTISTQMSQLARLEKHFGDLGEAFEKDRFETIRARLAYSKEDERQARPNPAPFPIEGDVYSNLSSYRTTLNYYRAFRTGEEPAEGDAIYYLDAEFLLSLIDAMRRVAGPTGHVSFEDFNRIVPIRELTGIDLEAVHQALAKDGFTVDEPEAPISSIDVGPDGTLAIDARELDKMREAFLSRFPDFEAYGFEFSKGDYWEVERSYKQVLIDTAADFLQMYPGRPEKIGTVLLELLASKKSNLLDWRELRRLKEVREANPGLIERSLGEMVASTRPPAESVAHCIEQIAEAYLEGQEGNRPFTHLRTLPSTVLALAKPKEAIAVRYTTMHRTGMRLTGGSPFRNAPMTAHEYQVVLDIAHHIEKVMREAWDWQPRDLWDVQGFLWVATEADKPSEPPEGATNEGVEPSIHDRYRTQADDPAMVDALERGPFAAVLAARITEIRESERTSDPESDRAFMVHLHGPWGSGKSSILNLLRKELEEPKEGEPSLVVMFNAWKQQRMRPPWWALMNAIYRRTMDRPGAWAERLGLWRRWWFWRWKAEVFPIALVGVIALGVIFLILTDRTRDDVEAAVKIGVVAAAALASIYAYARRMIFGSQKAVQTYADLTTDPYRRIVKLFNRIVAEIKPPLVVFVDDLDRCDSDYVVELLEGIQTLFRHAPVTYVVAADRKWICSSFEKKYGDFSATIGEPCRPLGYLFLDKLFQISAEMPRLTREVQSSYLAALLREDAARETAISPELIAEAEKRVSGISNEEDLQQLIADEEAQMPAKALKEDLDRQRALRHAAALQITSAQASAATEHRLQKLSHLLEPNPRSMKRLVNAVGMAQARGLLEGRAASPETRARWAMLSLRWPILADFIADHPEAIAHWKMSKGKGRRGAAADPGWPPAVRALDGDRIVMEVVGGDGDEGALTPNSLAPLLA